MAQKLTKRVIGTVGVDAGMCCLVDPCYVMGADAAAQMEWPEFLTKSGMLRPDGSYPEHGIVPSRRSGAALGVVVHTGDGDGEYPVTAYFDETGRCRKVEISFGRR